MSISYALLFAIRRFRAYWFSNSIAVASIVAATICTVTLGLITQEIVFADLPVARPSELVTLSPSATPNGAASAYPELLSKDEFDLLSQNSRTLTGSFGWFDALADFSVNGTFEKSEVVETTSQFFSALGLVPVLGRTFSSQDFSAAGKPNAPIAVISYSCWQRRFSGNPQVIGTPVKVGSSSFTIVGVAPKGFGGLRVGVYADVIIPFDLSKNPSGTPLLWMTARLRPRIAIKKVQAEMQTKWQHAPELSRGANAVSADRYRQLPYLEVSTARHGFALIRDRYRGTLLALNLLASLLLLIAYVNVGSLMLSRAIAGRNVTVVKLALGQTRTSALVESIIEASLLLLTANVIAFAAASVLAPVVMRSLWIGALPPNFRWSDGLPLTLTFFFLCALGSITVSMLSIFVSLHLSPSTIVAKGDQIIGVRGVTRIFQNGFLIIQVAVSLIIILSTAAISQRLLAVAKAPLGFDPEHISASFLTSVPGARIENRVSYYQSLLENVRGIPGVEGVTLSRTWPLPGPPSTIRCRRDASGQGGSFPAEQSTVGPSFFHVFRIPVLWGHDFAEDQTAQTRSDAIISQSLALALFGVPYAVDRTFVIDAEDGTRKPYHVIAVAADASVNDPHQVRPMTVYLPIFENESQLNMPVLQVRTAAGYDESVPKSVASVVRGAGKQYVWRERSIDHLVKDALSKERMSFLLSSICSLVSIVLSISGIFGVASYIVGLRMREAALRIALGASLRSIVEHRIQEIFIPVSLGMLGSMAALLAIRHAFPEFSVVYMNGVNVAWFVGPTVVLLVAFFTAALLPLFRFREVTLISLLRE